MFNILQWQILLLISSSLLMLACNSSTIKESEESLSKTKSYLYIEVMSKDDACATVEIEEEPIDIQQTSDSLAYLEAFQKFYISQQERLKTYEKYGTFCVGIVAKKFRLLNDSGIDIVPTIKFKTKELREKEIRDEASRILEKSDLNSYSL